MAAPRLTEEEVHAACADIAAQGESPTAVKLLDKLGRGSLTTITKYLNTWKLTGEAQAFDVESLPAVIQLPEELTKDGEDLLKKIWNIAKGIADSELDVQREALKQAEKDNQARVEEAFAFSEAQSMKIERLEEHLGDINAQLDEKIREHNQTVSDLIDAGKINVGLTKDNEQLQSEVEALKERIAELEKRDKAAEAERKALQDSHAAELKKKDAEIKSLDMQVHKLQTSLDTTVNANDKLKSDIKSKASELSSCTVELEKLGVRYESTLTDLKATRDELKEAKKMASQAEKQVANLEGQLEVYQSLDKSKKK